MFICYNATPLSPLKYLTITLGRNSVSIYNCKAKHTIFYKCYLQSSHKHQLLVSLDYIYYSSYTIAKDTIF